MSKTLERRSIVYSYTSDEVEAVVTGYEYDIGITIQSVTGKYLFCMNHPDVKVDGHKPMTMEQYDKSFKFMTNCIENGEYKAGTLSNALYGDISFGSEPSAQTCVFSQ